MSIDECPTGIPGFDEVLGGFYRGQLILVIGNAGSGKTTFAAKFLYEGARRFGEPGLYVGTGETKREFYRYMSAVGMDFESLEREGSFRFIEMLEPTSEDALAALSRNLIKNAMEMGVRRLVIDSITPFLALGSPVEARAILHNAIKEVVRSLNATAIVIAETTPGERGTRMEEFVADGVISMRLEIPEVGAPRRVMEIIKLRGRPTGRVAYEYEIGPPHGIRMILPGVLEVLKAEVDPSQRLTTGVEGLDEMLRGGVIKGTCVLITGPSGTGKTLIAAYTSLKNALMGNKVCFLSFEEPKEQIETIIRSADPLERPAENLVVRPLNPRTVTARSLYDIIATFTRLEEHKIDLLVVDGVGSLEEEFGRLFYPAMRDLVLQAKRAGVTVMLTAIEDGSSSSDPILGLKTLADTLIKLRIKEDDGKLRREVMVLKHRMSPSSNEIKELVLVNGRLTVKNRSEDKSVRDE